MGLESCADFSDADDTVGRMIVGDISLSSSTRYDSARSIEVLGVIGAICDIGVGRSVSTEARISSTVVSVCSCVCGCVGCQWGVIPIVVGLDIGGEAIKGGGECDDGNDSCR